ncbi:hypothetical protein [Actinomadura sp. HBU206391]|uniref:hypothetical protein n=1 Tax=Actinomadura sp. HBU206391 TaxID=2731692 RepID=UPI00164F3BDB|nr:hypothetical protein [Actinomadura sp. HBU206391]MBC6457732.1 hypothetical protein [Actinomadura sp. HBU206391]
MPPSQPFPPSPPPPSSNTGLLITLIAGGGFVVIVLVVVVLAASGAFSGGGGKKPAKSDSPTDKLAAAAQRLTTARGLNLRGTVSSGSDKLNGDFKITSSGWVTGNVTWNGETAQVIMPGDAVYVKAGWDFWRTEGNVSNKATWIGSSRWGKLSYSSLSSTVKSDMTPSAIASDLRNVSRYSVKSTVSTTVQGVPALKISTYGDVFYVSADDSPRLLRLETDYPQTAVDVTEVTSGQGDAVTELRSRINALKDSFDPSRSTRVDKISWGSCTTSGCTVHSKVWSTRSGSTSVRVTVFVRITANDKNGRKLGECSNSGTVTSLSSINVTCRVKSAAWTSFRGGTGLRRWWGRAEAMASGATSTEIQTMLSGLNSV